ncbi:MAG: NUDIX hydrolase [Paracoccaceae bacterium]|nr:NUDIX hydrolase [Paracoccaceae bacterium]
MTPDLVTVSAVSTDFGTARASSGPEVGAKVCAGCVLALREIRTTMSTAHTARQHEGDRTLTADIRPAATVIVLRDQLTSPRILMGQRSRSAVFMPSKFVFPGGVVDPADRWVPLGRSNGHPSLDKLDAESEGVDSHSVLIAGIRELWEETGLRLAVRGDSSMETWSAIEGWLSFIDGGVVPSAAGMQFIFRAITPPGNIRRYDTRFLLVDAETIIDDLDDLSGASGELLHLAWVPLSETSRLELPFITEIVLAELEDLLADPKSRRGIPFFCHRDRHSFFRHL